MTQATSSSSVPLAPRVQRDLGILTAVMVGLSAIIGAGVFLGIGIAAGIAGPAMLFAIVVAGIVAICSSLASARLLVNHAAKRGNAGHFIFQSYVDFFTGWTFIFTRAAAAATAALSLSGYALNAIDHNDILWRIGIGLAALVLVTGGIIANVRLSIGTTTLFVVAAILSLLFFCVSLYTGLSRNMTQNFVPVFLPPSSGTSPLRSIFHASALLFLAFAGSERIATLHGELRQSQRIVARAIIIAVTVAILLYTAVAAVAIGAIGAQTFANTTLGTFAPLATITAEILGSRPALLLSAGAIVAMVGVLYHLILGLAHTMLIMGRRKHMPNFVAKFAQNGKTPERAVFASVGIIAVFVSIGDIRIIWSFGAFTALVYYALNNFVALNTQPESRSIARLIPMVGLLSCLFLAFWVEQVIWATGIIVIVLGVGWRWLMQRI